MTKRTGETWISAGSLSPKRPRPCDLLVLEPNRVSRCGVIVVDMFSEVSGMMIRDANFEVLCTQPRGEWCWRCAVVSGSGAGCMNFMVFAPLPSFSTYFSSVSKFGFEHKLIEPLSRLEVLPVP